ncbi:ABC transporter ATP-binding protein [Lacrimispora indolis]|uniref:ABC transporter ATP-binding protein n=1 Tax=Lacrimispora indolis TaxID=69825 RepID=UPI0004219B45|nr:MULTISPECIES: ABC transporter ATP-binding protein [Lachnospiraceae]MBE7722701.1 ABC transporter ATP-binding protein [Lacrimispora celerecrescens]
MEQGRSITNHIIDCSKLSKTYNNHKESQEVIHNIDLSVGENEFVVILGPGQCGKSTLINLMSGLEKATSGGVTVCGKKVDGPDPERGVVFQSISLFPWLTTMGNVEYGLKMRGVRKKERQKKAQYYIDLVGLNGFEKSFPVALSGGMRQRVGIARAYCIEPKVLMMDEPFSALDAQTRYLMQEELQRIWEIEKRTILFVTNNLEEAIYLADRIIVLSRCPSQIKKEYVIDLPRPRNYVSPEFLALRKEIDDIMDSAN